MYLLGAFYEVQSLTLVLSLLIDSFTIYIPFRLLRPLSPAHAASRPGSIPNGEIVTDLSIQIYTSLLAAGIYSVTLYTAYASYLPVALVTYFSTISSISPAHSATPISLLPLALVLGFAAKTFIFTPAAAISSKKIPFNPKTATLGETFSWNLWGHTERSRVLSKRTLALVLFSGGNTFVQSFVTLEGVEAYGALAYSSVWVIAAGGTGAALGLVLWGL